MSTTIISPKPRAKRKPLPKIELPDHVRPTDHELAVFARYVRCSREGSSWIAVFVEYLLHADTCTDFYHVSVAAMARDLVEFAGIVGDRYSPDKLPEAVTLLRKRYPDFEPSLDGEGVIVPEKDEDYEFMELVRLWRIDHPEPQKKPTVPQGHLGCEESED